MSQVTYASLASSATAAPSHFVYKGFQQAGVFDCVCSIVWGTLLVDSVSRVACDALHCTSWETPSCSQFSQNALGLVSVSASIFSWAHSAEIILLSEVALTVAQAVSYGASAAIAGIGIVDAVGDLYNAWALCEKEETKTEGMLKKNKAIFMLIYRISSLVLALLGIVTLFVGVPFFPLWNTGLFLVNFISYLNAEGVCLVCPRMINAF